MLIIHDSDTIYQSRRFLSFHIPGVWKKKKIEIHQEGLTAGEISCTENDQSPKPSS